MFTYEVKCIVLACVWSLERGIFTVSVCTRTWSAEKIHKCISRVRPRPTIPPQFWLERGATGRFNCCVNSLVFFILLSEGWVRRVKVHQPSLRIKLQLDYKEIYSYVAPSRAVEKSPHTTTTRIVSKQHGNITTWGLSTFPGGECKCECVGKFPCFLSSACWDMGYYLMLCSRHIGRMAEATCECSGYQAGFNDKSWFIYYVSAA